MKIKAVIMSHDTPDTTSALYYKLRDTFDVTVFNVASSENQNPPCPSEWYANLYYTGCWREAMRRFGDFDVLWVIGGDVTLVEEPEEYKKAIESSMPFGFWSPCINGYCREIMSHQDAKGRVYNVYHLEGIAIAVSKSMMGIMDYSIPDGSVFGWGIDLWMSWLSWTSLNRNILDGRVSLRHPEKCGYDKNMARQECIKFMTDQVGPAWAVRARFGHQDRIFKNNIREEIKLKGES